MQSSITPNDMLGKTIDRIQQTPWEHTDEYSNCDFYLRMTDDSILELGLFGHFVIVDSDGDVARALIDIEADTDYPAFWSSDGFNGHGASIQRAYVDGRQHGSESNFYVLLSTGHWLTTDLLEGCPQLYLLDAVEFMDGHAGMVIYDYWTREGAAIGGPDPA